MAQPEKRTAYSDSTAEVLKTVVAGLKGVLDAETILALEELVAEKRFGDADAVCEILKRRATRAD